MKQITAYLFIVFAFTACHKNEVVIDISQLHKDWEVVAQQIEGKPVAPYTAISIAVNIDNHETTTTYFNMGDSKFVFKESWINFNLLTENHGPYSGRWEFDESKKELRIESIPVSDSTWNESIYADGSYYPPATFLTKTYRIVELNATSLKLSNDNTTIILNPS